MAGIWIDQTDLVNVMSVATFAACFNNPVTGALDLDGVAATIDRAEQEVLSWLIDEYGTGIQSEPNLGADRFLKGCALEFAIVYAYDRHPEYVKANGKERADRYAIAEKRMERVLESMQRPTSLAKKPANVGGTTVTDGPRIITTGVDGTNNGGDF